MWDILLCHDSKGTFPSSGDGLFDVSFLESPGTQPAIKVTVETEMFHYSTRTVDTSDGGQALPPHSSAVQDRDSSENSDHGLWDRVDSTPANASSSQIPLSRDPPTVPGPGFSGDLSFMDVTRDPFFQFQDHGHPYLGVWEIGNL